MPLTTRDFGRTDWVPEELAGAVAEVIREHRDQWEQSLWFSGTVSTLQKMVQALLEDNSCGTTGCVAGWVTAFTLPGDTRIAGDGDFWNERTGISGRVADWARQQLNLDDIQSAWLFEGNRSEAEVLFVLDTIAAGRDWAAGRLDGGIVVYINGSRD